MSARILIVALLIGLITASSAFAQQPTARAKTPEERITALEQELEGLKRRLTAAENGLSTQGTSIATLKSDLESKLDKLTGVVETQTGNIGKLSTVVGGQQTQIDSLKTEANTLTTRVNGQLELHAKILTDVARDDGGRYVPQLNAAMARETFRQEMDAAVHATLKTRGEFHIVNKMSSPQWISVNRVEHLLQAGEEKTLEVPVGTVTTQLPGQELVNWTLAHVGNGVYSEGIEIVPSRAPTRTIVESPVYVWPPIYSGSAASISNPIISYR
jgi:uncharacterized coiled-coil protein SlyX